MLLFKNMTKQLITFVSDLVKDPAKRKEFNQYREKVMESYNLNEDEKQAIRSRDPEKIRTAIQNSIKELGVTGFDTASDIRIDVSITISVEVFAE